MEYLLVFLEGIITFVSPCLLPMLPVYISYFTGDKSKNNQNNAVINSLGFVLGFTIIFITLGAFAGVLGGLLIRYSTIFNIISGTIVIILGLNFLEFINIPFLNQTSQRSGKTLNMNFFSAIIFGMVFSISWTPCVGAFLGSALTVAAQSGEATKGVLMLFFYSLGLGIPFVLSAILIDKLKSTFNFINKNRKVVNLISGGFLVIVGFLIATGKVSYYLGLLA